MALSAKTVWEVQTGGSDTNGGGFVPGSSGTDWTVQASAKYALTNGHTQGTTIILTPSATADMVGNLAYITGGTGAVVAAWYQITAASVGVSITVDRSTGLTAGTGATINIGGAFASLGNLGAAGWITGNTVYVKAGTYTISTATVNVSGGTLSNSTSQLGIGYSTNRTTSNTDTPPVINYGASTITMFATRGVWRNFTINGNGQTSAKLTGPQGDGFILCTFQNMNVASAGTGTCVACVATGCSATIFASNCFYCEATSNTSAPFAPATPAILAFCVAYGNSATGFGLGGSSVTCVNCVSYNNTVDGFSFGSGGRAPMCINCHAEGNTGAGFNSSSAQGTVLHNCSAFSNTGGATSFGTNTVLNNGFITVTVGTVFVNAAGNNFALNNLVNQGALLRAAGFVATGPSSSTANYLDIGAYQHQDAPATIINQVVNVRFGDEA